MTCYLLLRVGEKRNNLYTKANCKLDDNFEMNFLLCLACRLSCIETFFFSFKKTVKSKFARVHVKFMFILLNKTHFNASFVGTQMNTFAL